ncbi:MAG: protein-L-isoaspartate(D-aspartate) O-methyltransferase [Candidatus Competibacteraceae bacterium]|nr:protein-L-isoaspartate(D-aspartate) O-methyltransferase [Candidatus Competibacteraceae bacterium]
MSLKSCRFGGPVSAHRARQRMVQRLVDDGLDHPRVIAALLETPRHLFVEEALALRAYEDTALPIGFGQTISRPSMVARMSQILLGEGAGPAKVLEVGTGSGYQTAVLARLVQRVFSVERLERLLGQARVRLRDQGHRQVRLAHGDGYLGWARFAPYDGILVTAACPQIPPALLTQLRPGGRLVMPLGEGRAQQLLLVTRDLDGFQHYRLGPVSFVPLRGGVL